MSEGMVHSVLVSRIADLMRAELGDQLDMLLMDLPGTKASDKPPRVGRFVPDIYVQSGRRIFLGEAKTAIDLETDHTRAQLRGFLEHVSHSPAGSKLVVAVPLFMAARAKLLVAHIALEIAVGRALWVILGAEATSNS